MASLFGIFRKMFGGSDEAERTTHEDGGTEAGKSSKTIKEEKSMVDEITEVAIEAEEAAVAAAAAIGGASGIETDAMTTAVTSAFADEDDDTTDDTSSETPSLPPLELKKEVVYLDRDHFNLPQSETVGRAIDFVNDTTNGAASGRAMRVYDYGVAAADAYELRVDKELLALAAIFNEVGDFAASKAESFLLENNMWKSLAAKVAAAIQHQEDGLTSNDVETRVLALGLQAEAAHGEVEYVHPATAAETRARHQG